MKSITRNSSAASLCVLLLLGGCAIAPNEEAAEQAPAASEAALNPSFSGHLWAQNNTGVTVDDDPETEDDPTNTTLHISSSGSQSGYVVAIYDANTGTLLNTCATGSTCNAWAWSGSTPPSAGTHSYVAYITSNTANMTWAQLASIATSNTEYVTWTLATDPDTGDVWDLSMSTREDCMADQTITVTASSTGDVWNSPYWIHIYDSNGNELGSPCGNTPCTKQFTCPSIARPVYLHAFLTPSGSQSSLVNTLSTAVAASNIDTVYVAGY